ncbi:MAG TPA: ComF family protein [Burkholderiaceae bacterium]|nr:ComF family protein [Burkholderiaceae bacterium]
MMRSLAFRLLPPRCVVCGLQPGASSTSICAQCETDFFATKASRCERCAIRMSDVRPGITRVCGRCLAETPHFDTTTTLADYVSPIDGMVMALKFTARLDLAHFFGQMLSSRWSALSPSSSGAVVIPVPLAFERTQQRGFNQSHHIARAFASAAGRRLVVDRLLRVRHTAPQQTLALKERRRNIRGAFAVEGRFNQEPVLVVDDVMTSGSTLDEVALVLKKAGASQVHNLIVARTP